MKIRNWIAATLRAPFRFGCILLTGIYLLITLLWWSALAALLSEADTVANLAGAVMLVIWIAFSGTAAWVTYRVNRAR